MRWICALIQKDLLQTYRDKLSLLFTFLLPVVFTMFFGFLFGGVEGSSLPVAVVNQDPSGGTTAQLLKILENSDVVTLVQYDAKEAERAVADNRVAAALIIPRGFSSNTSSQETASVSIVRNPESSGGRTAEQAVRQAVGRVNGGRLAAQTALAALFPGIDPTDDPQRWSRALSAANAAMAKPALSIDLQSSGARAGEIPRGFDMSSPGMLINWILFGLLGSAITLVKERQNGALRRLLTTRVRPWQIIAGKGGAMITMTLAQQVILIGLGQFAFGVHYLRSPGALALTMITLSVMSAALGLMLATLLRSEAALIAALVIVSMVLAALGGAWFPLEVTGPTFAAIGHLSPAAWVLDALRAIILRGWSVGQILPYLGAAWGYTVVFLGIALWRFRFE